MVGGYDDENYHKKNINMKCPQCNKEMEMLPYNKDTDYFTSKNAVKIKLKFVCHNCFVFYERDYIKWESITGRL